MKEQQKRDDYAKEKLRKEQEQRIKLQEERARKIEEA